MGPDKQLSSGRSDAGGIGFRLQVVEDSIPVAASLVGIQHDEAIKFEVVLTLQLLAQSFWLADPVERADTIIHLKNKGTSLHI